MLYSNWREINLVVAIPGTPELLPSVGYTSPQYQLQSITFKSRPRGKVFPLTAKCQLPGVLSSVGITSSRANPGEKVDRMNEAAGLCAKHRTIKSRKETGSGRGQGKKVEEKKEEVEKPTGRTWAKNKMQGRRQRLRLRGMEEWGNKEAERKGMETESVKREERKEGNE